MKFFGKKFGIVLGVIMMVSLFGCEKPANNIEIGNPDPVKIPMTDLSQIEFTEEDLLNAAVGDNIVFDYYEAVQATVDGNDSKEFVLYTCDYSGYLILVRYTKDDGGPEYSSACLVPATTLDDCMKAVKKYKMTKWKDEVGITGKIFVVRVTVDGEFYRITSESMPEDGMKAFDEIAGILGAAWKDGITK